jgi:hypothetical protein
MLIAALSLVAAPALASGVWTASPSQPLSKQGIIAGAVLWSCDSSSCRSTSDTTDADALTSCRELARQVGRIAAFEADGRAFSVERLASCNLTAKH